MGCFNTLQNLVDKGFNNDMNDQGAIDVLSTLLTKKWPDEEIPEDIRFLKSALQKDIKELRCTILHRTDRGPYVLLGAARPEEATHTKRTRACLRTACA